MAGPGVIKIFLFLLHTRELQSRRQDPENMLMRVSNSELFIQVLVFAQKLTRPGVAVSGLAANPLFE